MGIFHAIELGPRRYLRSPRRPVELLSAPTTDLLCAEKDLSIYRFRCASDRGSRQPKDGLRNGQAARQPDETQQGETWKKVSQRCCAVPQDISLQRGKRDRTIECPTLPAERSFVRLVRTARGVYVVVP